MKLIQGLWQSLYRIPFVASISSISSGLRTTIVWSFQGYCLSVIFGEFGEFGYCEGPSMLPTFNEQWDYLLVEKVRWKFGRQLGLGDVVVFISPVNPLRSVCKRLIGLPGDHVIIDPVVKEREFITVPPGHIWVQGDNADNSRDSREYGPVPMGLVRGKVFCRVFPQFKLIPGTGARLVE